MLRKTWISFTLLVVATIVFGPFVFAAQKDTYVVQFFHAFEADKIATNIKKLEAVGIKDAKALRSPVEKNKTVYRIVSRSYTSEAEAKLAASEYTRALKKQKDKWESTILKEPAGSAYTSPK